MNISSIPSTSSVIADRNTGRTGNFDALLKTAMKNRNSMQFDTTDTFELSNEGSIAKTTRNLSNASKKLDENRQPFDAVIQTPEDQEEFRKVFHQFVGQTMFGQMLKSMRETQEKPAYFHGGRAEEIFQGQLDQILVDKMTAATSNTLDDAMFQLMPKM